jgi:Family of unknown function (DUF6461)
LPDPGPRTDPGGVPGPAERADSSGNRFYWIEDGDVRLYFEPLDPAYREGSTPDALAEVMREVGFDLSEDGENVEHPMEAAFALAEHLTGVRVTPEILEEATWLCGVAPVPPGLI